LMAYIIGRPMNQNARFGNPHPRQAIMEQVGIAGMYDRTGLAQTGVKHFAEDDNSQGNGRR
jgi:hypothetical protein